MLVVPVFDSPICRTMRRLMRSPLPLNENVTKADVIVGRVTGTVKGWIWRARGYADDAQQRYETESKDQTECRSGRFRSLAAPHRGHGDRWAG
jgi:hypothetical protein